MSKQLRLSSNSLVLTVVIALILAIICSSLIMLAYFNRQTQLQAGIDLKLKANLESATNLVLSDTSLFSIPQTDVLDLFGDAKDSVQIKRMVWGVFSVASITAFHYRFSQNHIFWYGISPPGYMDASIYVADHARPVTLIGNTKLIGDVYLSEAGIRSGYIDQRGYGNNELFEGKQLLSEKKLPAIRQKSIWHINFLLDSFHLLKTDTYKNYKEMTDSTTISFKDTALIIYQRGPIKLSEIVLNGQILIKSDSSIEIDKTASLNNVLLVAPYIHFKERFSGSVQAIASDSIVTDSSCFFSYPSALILRKDNSLKMQNSLRIGGNCYFNGVIVSVCKEDDIFRTYAEIEKNTTLEGVVYMMGYLSLKGNIKGTVLTDYFIYKTNATVYENHLVDVAINRKQLPSYYLLPGLFSFSSTQNVVQWVK